MTRRALVAPPAPMPKSRSSPRHERLLALLVEERKKKGLSQIDHALLLGKPQSFVSKYENGERRLDVIELIDIASKLGCSVIGLMEALLAVVA